ncbi:MAG: hypothetical protein H6553_08560 [Chitinophagales bacterium]|nr:hypothetical protein [Chitinophagales bacterium]
MIRQLNNQNNIFHSKYKIRHSSYIIFSVYVVCLGYLLYTILDGINKGYLLSALIVLIMFIVLFLGMLYFIIWILYKYFFIWYPKFIIKDNTLSIFYIKTKHINIKKIEKITHNTTIEISGLFYSHENIGSIIELYDKKVIHLVELAYENFDEFKTILPCNPSENSENS